MGANLNHVVFGDCRASMRAMIADGVKAQTCVTSPPYFGLRDYGHTGQIGLEATPDEYVAKMVEVFGLVRDLLADDGTLWLNLGDCYASSPPGNSTVGVSAKSGLHGVNALNGIYRETLAAGHATKRDSSKLPGIKPKNLIGIPWRVAFALQADGWYLRQDIIWAKPNPMPESVTDRCTKSHEYIFLLSKSPRYFYDHEAIKEPAVADHAPVNHTHKGATAYATESGEHNRTKAGLVAYAERQRGKGGKNAFRGQGHFREGEGGPANRDGRDMQNVGAGETRNKRSVWTVATTPYKGAHFATFPPALIEPCILAGSRPGDIVFDPFMGSGTTAQVAQTLGRRWLGCELNEAYAELQQARTMQTGLELA